jgi:NADH-quinone oxidoreductase subunit N
MLAGDGRRTPFAAGVLALCLFSLAGIPATAGFIGKFFLFKAALQSGLSPWPHRDANSLVSVGYYLKVVTFLHALTRSMTSSPALRPRIAFALALCAIGIRDRHLPRHPVAVAAMPPRLASGPTSSVPASGRLARQAR